MIAYVQGVTTVINDIELEITQMESTLTIRFPKLLGRMVQVLVDVGIDDNELIRLRTQSIKTGLRGAEPDPLNQVHEIVLHTKVGE